MASSKSPVNTDNFSGSPAPVTSTSFKIVKVRKPDGTIVTVKRRVLALSNDEDSKKTPATSNPEQPTPVTAKKSAGVIPSASEPAISAAAVPKSDTRPKDSTSKAKREARPAPISSTNTPIETSEKSTLHRIAATPIHFIRRNFHTVYKQITSIWSTYDSDMSAVGDVTEDDSDDSVDSDDNSSRTSNQGSTQSRRNRIHVLHSPPRASSQIFEQKPSTSEKKQDKLGTEVDEKQIDDAGNPSDAQPRDTRGRRVRKRTVLTQFGIGLFTIGIPFLFIILGILIVRLKGKSFDSRSGARIQEAIKVGVTLWPIVFAAVISQSLKALASYMVERGIRIMTLEQLISSHSVGTVIRQPFILRKVDLISFALLCLWSLSPLASQAMQRMSYVVPGNSTTNAAVYYLDTTQSSLSFNDSLTYSAGNNSGSTSTAGDVLYSAFLDALYSAAFLPPTPTGSEPYIWYDGWGNTRIPLIQRLNTADLTEWQLVPDTLVIEDYSSLYGIPVVQNQPVGDSNSSLASTYWEFTIDSAYWNFTCSAPVEKSWDDIYAAGRNLTESPGGTLHMGMDFTRASDGSLLGQLYFGSAIISGNGTFEDADGTDAAPLAYSECTFTQTFVQTFVSCITNMTYCQPVSMRLTPDPPASLEPTAFTDWMTYASEDSPSLTERYILNPSPAEMDELNPDKGFSLLGVSQNDFTQRLAMAVNTFWSIGFAPMYITGDLMVENDPEVAMLEADAIGGVYSNVYTYSPAWTAVLFLCSIILITFGITNVIWESRTIGPNVLGFASSIVRNSRYIDAPRISSAMSGPEKARLLGDLKVMMQDVRAGDEVGKIALGTVSEGAQRLRSGRLYK